MPARHGPYIYYLDTEGLFSRQDKEDADNSEAVDFILFDERSDPLVT